MSEIFGFFGQARVLAYLHKTPTDLRCRDTVVNTHGTNTLTIRGQALLYKRTIRCGAFPFINQQIPCKYMLGKYVTICYYIYIYIYIYMYVKMTICDIISIRYISDTDVMIHRKH